MAEKEKKTEEVQDQKKIIVTNNGVYDLVEYDWDHTVPEYGKAYHINTYPDYFFLYRGRQRNDSILPGIYIGENELPVILPPSNDAEAEEYKIETHLSNMNPGDMLVVLRNKKNIQHVYTENSKLYIPEVKPNDNILKRALKEAFQCKDVTIEACKDGFSDRNAFFNFSSQMRSEDGNISFLLMDRGCTALKLGYAIVLYELDPENPVGKPLTSPEVSEKIKQISSKTTNPLVHDGVIDVSDKIAVCSEDSFDLL